MRSAWDVMKRIFLQHTTPTRSYTPHVTAVRNTQTTESRTRAHAQEFRNRSLSVAVWGGGHAGAYQPALSWNPGGRDLTAIDSEGIIRKLMT